MSRQTPMHHDPETEIVIFQDAPNAEHFFHGWNGGTMFKIDETMPMNMGSQEPLESIYRGMFDKKDFIRVILFDGMVSVYILDQDQIIANVNGNVSYFYKLAHEIMLKKINMGFLTNFYEVTRRIGEKKGRNQTRSYINNEVTKLLHTIGINF